MFQSSSGLSTGCYQPRASPGTKIHRFQSSSGPSTGCYAARLNTSGPTSCFNPHPVLRPDATSMLGERVAKARKFQSSSGPSTGCYATMDSALALLLEFQSSSGPSTGCYRADHVADAGIPPFQSSSGPSTGCYCHVWFSYLTSANLRRRSLKFLFFKRFLHVLHLVFSYGREPRR